MIESFFFDFDGTLQGFENHELSESTIEALHKLKQNNKKIYIATGRNLSDMPESIFEIGFNGYINNNGGMCSDANRNTFFTEYIHSDDIKALLEYDKKNPVAFSYMTTKNPFSINRVNENIEKSFNQFGLKVPEVINPRDLPNDNIIQMNLFVNEEEERFLLENVLKNSVGTRWIEYFADINPKDVNKMEGIKRIAKRDNLDLSKTMSFGDGGNDIKMLEGCKIGVAMGNANKNVKEIADHITSSVDEHGVWNALKHYDFI
ncbi:HAD family hydrolase [Chishuiella sp.]|uniref:HAD family hydrolase n=1 Tax=Chishuiella sp. TaxID=1969467 RepID=UPI0028A7AE96|nr:HAD family hydrolase [Chishuiella sp.]